MITIALGIKFKNIKTKEELDITQYNEEKFFTKEDIQNLYEKTLRPAWNEYKKENGYKEK